MLNSTLHRRPPGSERGIVLIIALIVLVIMTLAGISMMRSADTTNLVAGNISFQQSATMASDSGVEVATAELIASAASTASPTVPYDLDGITYAANAVPGATIGYISNGLNPAYYSPPAGTSWETFWQGTLVANNLVKTLATDPATGNTVAYIIHRLCTTTGALTAGGMSCATTKTLEDTLYRTHGYYRITVRTRGPHGTVSFVQAVVSM